MIRKILANLALALFFFCVLLALMIFWLSRENERKDTEIAVLKFTNKQLCQRFDSLGVVDFENMIREERKKDGR
jgi:hypothetical protein